MLTALQNSSPVFSGNCNISNYKACLKGGAIGDALGAPVEFYRINSIKKMYGNDGIQDLLPAKNGKAMITDDTQMTMFTADGILKSLQKKFSLKELPDMKTIFNSYKLWLNTQLFPYKIQTGKGWISGLKDLYARRAPGNTCLGALINGAAGSPEHPVNNSSGCGGVMRAAPAGLVYKDNPELAFDAGSRCAAITHGNPQGYLSAGFLSGMIAHILGGENIESSVDKTLKILKKYKGHESVTELINLAKHLAKTNTPSQLAVETLGEGWTGHEAIAISVYCALKEPENFEKAVKMAVNHSGDSDSTGSITGNILGAQLSMEGIPKKWQNKTELSKELEILAEDLYKPSEIKDAQQRYPI